MAKLRHHSFRSDTGTSKRRPDGQIRNGNITHPTRVAPVVTGIQVVPGASAQAATTTNREASGAEGVIAEPKKTLTRIEQCITDAANSHLVWRNGRPRTSMGPSATCSTR
jgi:hypothetical protein